MTDEQKLLCGFPRKRVACCSLTTAVIAAVVVVAVLFTRPVDDIATQEQMESASTTADEVTVLSTASLSGTGFAEGTLSLLLVTDDNSSFVALNDFEVVGSDCIGLEVRLQAVGSSESASSGDGIATIVPLTAAAEATDFTEPLESDFDANIYDQVRKSKPAPAADLKASSARPGQVLVRGQMSDAPAKAAC